MKSARLFAAIGLWLLPVLASLHAQVPQIIGYQGRVAVGGVNFTGTGQFRFALVDTAGATTFWSNDGTSVAGTEPTAPVSLAVAGGLYSVLLGDALLPNMTAISSTVFNHSDVRLRVWFDDGMNGSQLLAPDQRIAAVGYAMMAGNVQDGAIDTAKLAAGAVTSAKIAPGAVTATELGAGAVTTAKIAAGAVTGTEIAAGAIASTQLAPGSVGFSKLAKPPQAGTVDGAGLNFDFPNEAPFIVTFPQAYVSPPVVTLSLAPTATPFPAETAAQVTSVSSTGFGGKVIMFGALPMTIDSTGAVGLYSSLVVVNGNPAISYYDQTNLDLRFVRATHSNGTAWGSIFTLDGTGDVGRYTSMAMVNGTPAICYYDATNLDLKYVRANNPSGTVWGTPVPVDSAGNVGETCSLAVIDGNPAISYFDTTNGDLKYVRATNPAGTAWDTPITIDSAGFVGLYTSLAVVNGSPAISYLAPNADLRFVRATDNDGSAWGTPVTIDSVGNVGYYTSLAVVNGNPAISYYDLTNENLKYVGAIDSSGTAWGAPITIDSAGSVGFHASLAVVNGNPAISYMGGTETAFFGLKYVRATNASGTSWGAPTTVDVTRYIGIGTSLAVVNGKPAISYQDGINGDLKFARPANLPSFKVNWIALPP